jgi:tRNA pseudouridine38-40 synthase
LKEAVRRISGEENEITGASRTDGGAHAKGQVCHFDTDSSMPPERWARVLTKVLPPDLVVHRSSRVPQAFHARFCAEDRFYRYRIHLGPRDPHRTRYVFESGFALDLQKMQEGAAQLIGDHDFRAFTEELEPHVNNTRRTLRSVRVRRVRDEVWVDVVGTAFLRGMMRRMSGALFEIGRGIRPVVEVSKLLDPEQRDKLQWPVVLPAKGLCLMKIRYTQPLRDHRVQFNSSLDLP